MLIRTICSLALVLICLGLTSTAQTVTPSANTMTDKADSDADKTTTMATVYVYRFLETKPNAATTRTTLYSDGKQVAELTSGRYLLLLLDPGKHTFATQSGSADAFELEVQRGQKYYVRVDAGSGKVKTDARKMALVETERGASEVRQLTPIETKDVKKKDAATVVSP